MSTTTTVTPPASAATPAPESLWTAQTIVALIGMLIVAGTVAAVMYQGDPQLRSQALVGAIAIGSAITGFYFGSSKGSQDKTAALAAAAAPPPGATTTTTTSPATPPAAPAPGATP